MKPKFKVMIAGAVTALAATFSTVASAESLIELHEQHKAQLFNFLRGVQANITVGSAPGYYAPPAPVYQAPPPVYAQPYPGRDPRWEHHRGPDGYARGYGYDHRGDRVHDFRP